MVLDFLGNQALYLALARGDAEPLAATLREFPEIPAGRAGALRAQPRRAHARQADRGRARRRSSRASAPTRTCSSTGAACAAGCRPCSTATSARSGWSTRSRSRCRARRCCSTARRSGWARTSRSRAATACARRCSGRPSRHGGFSTAEDAEALRRPVTEGASARARQRRRPAPRPRLAAELVRAPHPPPPRVPRDRLRHARRCSRPARRRCSPTAATGRARRSSPCTSSAARRSRSTCRSTTARRWSTCSATTPTSCRRRSRLAPHAAHWFRVRRGVRAAAALVTGDHDHRPSSARARRRRPRSNRLASTVEQRPPRPSRPGSARERREVEGRIAALSCSRTNAKTSGAASRDGAALAERGLSAAEGHQGAVELERRSGIVALQRPPPAARRRGRPGATARRR